MTAPLRYELRDRAAWLTFCTPTNVLGPETGTALMAAVERARTDDVHVVVLRAEGPMFCVGGDVSAFAGAADRASFVGGAAEGIARIVTALQGLDAVVVSVVQGTAAGAGVPLAAAADLVLAGESARFVLAYTQIGFTMDGGASLLPATLGLHRALHLSLLNPVLTPQQAHAAGLVAQLHPDDELERATEAVVAQLLAGSRSAQVAAKRLLRGQAVADPAAAMQTEADSMRTAAASPDGVEGVDAFLARRPPRFGGVAPASLTPSDHSLAVVVPTPGSASAARRASSSDPGSAE